MNTQKVVVNNYSFDCISSTSSGNQAVFKIANTENYSDIKTAFRTNKGVISITYNDKVMQQFSDFTKLTSILDSIDAYTVTMVKEYDDVSALEIIVGTHPTVSEAQEYRENIEKIAENISDDENAIEQTWAFPNWRAGKEYEKDNRVVYNGELYRVILAHTSQEGWEPNVATALFTNIANPAEEWPAWIMPTGAHNTYKIGDKVSYNNKHWISEVDNNVWEPGISGWVTEDQDDEPVEPIEPVVDEYPEWVQPLGAGDAYSAGAKVSHNEQHWISDVDNNTWEPGVYGWTVEE